MDWRPGEVSVQGDDVYVDDMPLGPGESYTRTYLFQSANLWEVHTSHIAIHNKGRTAHDAKALFISGDIHEGWMIGPIGMIVLLTGIILLVRVSAIERQITSGSAEDYG
jgi:hypothetical protein